MKRLNFSYFIATALIVSAMSAGSLFASAKANAYNSAEGIDEVNYTAETDSVILTGTFSNKDVRSYLGRPVNGLELSSLLKSKIKYPETATANNIQGRVQVLLTVDQTGSISEIKVIESPNEELSGEVEKALGQINFEPVFMNGTPLKKYKIILPFHFELF